MTEKTIVTGYPSIDKPWLKYYTEEAINAPQPECTIYEYLFEANKEYPDDIAINYYGRKITYKELFDNIDITAKGFNALGVKHGDIVTIALPSLPEALYAIYALNKLGAVANMIHPLAGEKEITNYLNEVESTVAVFYEGTYEIMKNTIAETCVKKVVVVSAAESLPKGIKLIYTIKHKPISFTTESLFLTWSQFINAGKPVYLPSVNKNPNEMAVISHTGGTTGEPKGVMCSDKNINALIYQLVCNFEYTRQGTCLAVLPPFINYSLIDSMMAMLYIGFEVVLIPKYEPEKLSKYIKRYQPYVINSIPTYWEALLKTKGVEHVDMSCLRYIYYGGEAMSVENELAVNKVLQACGARGPLCKGLGSTEMMAAATQTYEDCNANGTAGVPLVWVNCKIVEPNTSEELPYNKDGEICFTGPTLMLGYYNNPEATAEIVKTHVDGQQWLHTGDIGHIDENGILYVTGRIKRILVTRGKDGVSTKMFPDRIERVICQHNGVELCCVIGIPEEKRINYPKAFIVARAGKSNLSQLADEILALCKNELPDYMVPEDIEFRDDLPRTARGKIDYRALEKESKEKR